MSAQVERVTGPAPLLYIPEPAQRDDLAAFTARVVQLDGTSVVRLRGEPGQPGPDGQARVVAWASTPFEVVATRAVRGEVRPADLTVQAGDLLAALAVVRHAEVDPGGRADARWRAELPPSGGWRTVADLPAAELAELADAGLAEARDQAAHGHGHGGGSPVPAAELLDRTVRTAEGNGLRAPVPLRCLFALSGLGYLVGGDSGAVRVSATGDRDWVRLDTPDGAVVRRRRALLPLLV
jgi:hypothetical protein